MKALRAKGTKLLFFIAKHANLWHPRRRPSPWSLKLPAPCTDATNQTWTLTIKNAANFLLLEPEQSRCCKKFRLYSILHHETWTIVVKCPTFHAWFLRDRPPCKRSGGTIRSSQHRGRVYQYRPTESISISWVELTSFVAIEAIK